MKLSSLNEYRCKCGKLLFKGHIILSFIEIKCKRCGFVNFFQDNEQKIPISFSITTNSSGKIIDTCSAISLIGVSRNYFLGRNIKELFPSINEKTINKNNTMKIRHTIPLLHNNTKKFIESYIIPYSENGKFDGYHIFNKLFSG